MSADPPASGDLEVRAELDVPGETKRQARVFAVWFVCLALAVLLGGILGRVEHAGTLEPSQSELAASRARRLKIAGLFGLLLPALLTLGVRHHHRRGGPHARGIVVDVTADGELRIWGRGYGARVTLSSAEVKERLVDVYAGRLGAWRQRRLSVRAASAVTGAREIEIATPAVAADLEAELRVDGGEGDCVELRREEFDLVRARVLELARPASS